MIHGYACTGPRTAITFIVDHFQYIIYPAHMVVVPVRDDNVVDQDSFVHQHFLQMANVFLHVRVPSVQQNTPVVDGKGKPR